MSHDQIIEWAREAGFNTTLWHIDEPICYDAEPIHIEAFAALVAAHEREQCALVCEAGVDQAKEDDLFAKSRAAAGAESELGLLKFWSTVALHNSTRKKCVVAIRARGTP